jgi:predicted  nucleic acid-binding Zn-ribbon protein
METKEELVTNIKEWIKMDTEISQLQNEIKERKNKKKLLTEQLMDVMKKNDIDCFDINGGSLVYKKNMIKKPISSKMLISTLQTYFESNPGQAEDLTKFIMENREEQVKEVIKRKVNK